MEKLQVTEARELCQLHGINIEPVEIAYHIFDEKTKQYRHIWGTFIKMGQGSKTRLSKRPYLRPTLWINGKKETGWEEKIDQLWVLKARQIKKRLTLSSTQKQAA